MWLIRRQNNSHVQDPAPPSAVFEPQGFTAPAQGDAFDFTVTAYCTSTAAGWRRVGFWRDSSLELERLLEVVRVTVRETARRFSVFEAGRAEHDANRRVAERLAEAAADADGIGAWTVRVELRPPGEVLDVMRENTLARYRIEADAEADTLRLRKTDDLRLRWQRFLEDTAASPTARYAMRLTKEPENAADILGALHDERRKGAEDLLEHVTRLADALQSADILGLVVSSETVLRTTLKMMGVQIAPMDDDSMLVPADSSV
ncbi:hypothetical protein LUW76_08400 [Actinomadura madurae]|uniref:hypothetical protein n=1 Tax=Actinomadura madurae TaxID=1993 RepID=UPI0020272943|nr:hypothetical protein [Actinomadura madurae]URM94351.1 hypothetical protein LUW76_08400 [Actinomadura madurae]